jgi:hypothetical protein
MLRRIPLFVSSLAAAGAALAHPGHPGRILDDHIHPEEWLAIAALGILVIGWAFWAVRKSMAARRSRKP